MTLPRRQSRTLTLSGSSYRWLVSMRHGVLHVTVQADTDPGQILQAHFEPHDQFERRQDGTWAFLRQGRSITPDVVTQIIRHGLANGWQPHSKKQKPLQIHTWQSDRIVSESPAPSDGAVQLKDLAIEQVSELRFGLSLDPKWRKTLFDAVPGQRFPICDDDCLLYQRVRECGLRFAAFNDGYTPCGFVVFGIESIDFPDVVMYTTNNPVII